MKPAWKPPLPSGPPPKKSSAVSPPKIPAKQVGLHSSIQASVSPPRIALKISSDSELPPPIPSEDDLFELPPPIPDDYELHERGSVIAPGINNPQEETALIHDLRIAIAELDREQMGFLLNRARKINASECKEIMRAKELCYGISDAQFVDLKLQQALNSKQTMRIKGLLAEANKAGLNSMNFNLAKQFISQKLDEARERIEKIGSFRDYSHKMSQYRVSLDLIVLDCVFSDSRFF